MGSEHRWAGPVAVEAVLGSQERSPKLATEVGVTVGMHIENPTEMIVFPLA